MEHVKTILPRVMKDLLKKVYEGRAPLHQKIAFLCNSRRAYHGNEEMQAECNKYLTLLYDEKYKILKEQSNERLENKVLY